MRAIVIAGTHSGCGKTTVTLGVLAAFKKKGLVVQSFKAGPDFIDSGIHRLITGRPSRNLDLWMCGGDYVKDCFMKYAADADMAVVEGVMGMYDGRLSTAHLAAFLDLPVILVVDAYGMAESAGAVVQGFVDFGLRNADRGLQKSKIKDYKSEMTKSEIRNQKAESTVAGIIFNRVASERHYERLRKSVREIPVLGYLPRDLTFEIPHRHLGLTVAEENPLSEGDLGRLADAVLRFIDLEAIMKRQSGIVSKYQSVKASQCQRVKVSQCQSVRMSKRRETRGSDTLKLCGSDTKAKIAVAYDKAFCFYYEDNLDLLRDAGIEIMKFSPLVDSGLPKGVGAVYIGGGYPELHAKELSANKPMRAALRAWADEGRPMYAECGGLMYLSQGIHDFEDAFFPMAGVFPFETVMKKGRSHLGYRETVLMEDCMIGRNGDRLRGHEFHYSEIKATRLSAAASHAPTQIREIYTVRDGDGREAGSEGYRMGNTLASYIHMHFGSNTAVAKTMAAFIKEKRWSI